MLNFHSSSPLCRLQSTPSTSLLLCQGYLETNLKNYVTLIKNCEYISTLHRNVKIIHTQLLLWRREYYRRALDN